MISRWPRSSRVTLSLAVDELSGQMFAELLRCASNCCGANIRSWLGPAETGPSSIANETVFEPRGLNRELRSLVHQKAGMTPLWSEALGSFPEGLAPPAGTEAAAPAGPGAGERLGCES